MLQVALASLQSAEVVGPFDIFPGGAPFEKGDVEHEHEKDGVISNVSMPTLTVYLPPTTSELAAAMLVLPGGGYEHIYIEKEGSAVAQWLNSFGVAAAVLKYRCPLGLPRPHLPGLLTNSTSTIDFASEIWRPLQDAQRGMGLLRHRAQEFQINASRIGVVGFSAGGSLAAFLGTHWRARLYPPAQFWDAADAESCRPDCVVMVYPAPLIADKSTVKHLLPGLIVDAQTPPSFAAQASDDQFGAENSVGWWLANRKLGIGTDLSVFPSGGHGFGICNDSREVCTWSARAKKWMHTIGFLAANSTAVPPVFSPVDSDLP